MTVRALDSETGDIVTSGEQFIYEKNEVAQTIRTRLYLFAGEYFRDIQDGTDWFGKILTKQGTLESKDTIIQQRIRRTTGVVQLLSYSADFNLDAREYSIVTSVLTTYGEIDLQVNGVING